MKLIALTGAAGSGKDTVADHLVAKHGFVKYAFAGPLKQEAAQAYSLAPEDVEFFERREEKERPSSRLALRECADGAFIDAVLPDNWPEWGGGHRVEFLAARRSWRWVCQRWGTEYRRAQNPQYWLERAAEFLAGKDKVVITDCRFPNEAKFVRERGGVLWKIVRPEADPVAQHASEQGVALDLRDARLFNNSTIPYLLGQADLFVAIGPGTMEDARRRIGEPI